jgi:transcriptional antiterminator NusG
MRREGKEMGRKKYYALQVRTRYEDAFIERYNKERSFGGVTLYFPKRELRERKNKKTRLKLHPVFSGYVFLETDEGDDVIKYKAGLEKTDGFFRFLHSNTNIAEITGRDLDIVSRFLKLKNATAGVSNVVFNESNRIVVIDGPLKGLEGNIVKVDRRKERAKIRLDLYEDSFLIDLSFHVLEGQK